MQLGYFSLHVECGYPEGHELANKDLFCCVCDGLVHAKHNESWGSYVRVLNKFICLHCWKQFFDEEGRWLKEIKPDL